MPKRSATAAKVVSPEAVQKLLKKIKEEKKSSSSQSSSLGKIISSSATTSSSAAACDTPERKMAKSANSPSMEGSSKSKDSKERFTFFYKKDSPFSQFHSCRFTKDGITYNCAEQYMMHQKAVLFGDTQMAQAILSTEVPLQQKRFGRKVQNFVVNVWATKSREIVFDGNYHKFTQNKELLSCLMATDGTTLVEASPRDNIWGIGMGASNPLAQNRSTWKGKNYLGEALTQVRERIKTEKLSSNDETGASST